MCWTQRLSTLRVYSKNECNKPIRTVAWLEELKIMYVDRHWHIVIVIEYKYSLVTTLTTEYSCLLVYGYMCSQDNELQQLKH